MSSAPGSLVADARETYWHRAAGGAFGPPDLRLAERLLATRRSVAGGTRFAQAELDAAVASLRTGPDRALRADGVLGAPGRAVARSRTSTRARAVVAAAGAERRTDAGFFDARRTGAGAVVICTLLPAVAATAVASARADRPAGMLFAPYLAWSTYAAALNLEIWRRNRS